MRGLPCLQRRRLPAEAGKPRRCGTWGQQSPGLRGDRSKAVPTTRLFYDAHSEEQWRKKGFYSVLDNQGSQAALMARMLELGHKTPLTPNAKLPEEIVLGLSRNNMCPLLMSSTPMRVRTPRRACRWRLPG